MWFKPCYCLRITIIYFFLLTLLFADLMSIDCHLLSLLKIRLIEQINDNPTVVNIVSFLYFYFFFYLQHYTFSFRQNMVEVIVVLLLRAFTVTSPKCMRYSKLCFSEQQQLLWIGMLKKKKKKLGTCILRQFLKTRENDGYFHTSLCPVCHQQWPPTSSSRES